MYTGKELFFELGLDDMSDDEQRYYIEMKFEYRQCSICGKYEHYNDFYNETIINDIEYDDICEKCRCHIENGTENVIQMSTDCIEDYLYNEWS